MQSDTAGLSASVFLSVLGSAALAGLSRVAHNGTDAEASLTSGRRPSGVGGYIYTYTHTQIYIYGGSLELQQAGRFPCWWMSNPSRSAFAVSSAPRWHFGKLRE